MKYLIAFLLFTPLFAENEIDEIVQTYTTSIDPFLERMFDANEGALEQSPKTMNRDELLVKLRAVMQKPAFKEKFYAFYEGLYTPEELKKFSQFCKDETFIKIIRNNAYHYQYTVDLIVQTANEILDGGEKKAPSAVSSMTDFQSEVVNHKGLVIVDVYAEWCLPCKKMVPILDKLSNEYPKIKFFKTDSQEIAKRFNVNYLPCFLFFRDGRLVGRHEGLTEAEVMRGKILQLLAGD